MRSSTRSSTEFPSGKDGYSITDVDSDEFYAPQDAIDDEEWASRSHFVGNAEDPNRVVHCPIRESRLLPGMQYEICEG